MSTAEIMPGHNQEMPAPGARQKWDRRYTALSREARREPTAFVSKCLKQLSHEGVALDIAAGAGRHSLALARCGFDVDAVDISWIGLRVARRRAREEGLLSHIRFVVADVERPWLPRRRYDVLIISYFLHRPLFPLIRDRLGSDSWLIYETPTLNEVKRGSTRHPIHRDFLLNPRELFDEFSGLEIAFYDEGDHNGRFTAQLLARKR